MGTEALRVTGINHVVLHVADLERSLRFYVDLLGFEDRNVSGAPPGAKVSFLRCGMQGLDLFEVAGDVFGGREMNHMALNVAAEDLDQVVAGLMAAGIDASERTARNSVFVTDPDGHRLEMLPLSSTNRAREREAGAV